MIVVMSTHLVVWGRAVYLPMVARARAPTPTLHHTSAPRKPAISTCWVRGGRNGGEGGGRAHMGV